jgi:hypothetical protein
VSLFRPRSGQAAKEAEFTFAPQINPNSERILQQAAKEVPLLPFVLGRIPRHPNASSRWIVRLSVAPIGGHPGELFGAAEILSAAATRKEAADAAAGGETGDSHSPLQHTIFTVHDARISVEFLRRFKDGARIHISVRCYRSLTGRMLLLGRATGGQGLHLPAGRAIPRRHSRSVPRSQREPRRVIR